MRKRESHRGVDLASSILIHAVLRLKLQALHCHSASNPSKTEERFVVRRLDDRKWRVELQVELEGAVRDFDVLGSPMRVGWH